MRRSLSHLLLGSIMLGAVLPLTMEEKRLRKALSYLQAHVESLPTAIYCSTRPEKRQNVLSAQNPLWVIQEIFPSFFPDKPGCHFKGCNAKMPSQGGCPGRYILHWRSSLRLLHSLELRKYTPPATGALVSLVASLFIDTAG